MGTTTYTDPTADILFGKTRRDLLALLLGRPDERFYFRQILRIAGGGSGAVQRELKLLVQAGLVIRETEGRQVYFSANRQAAIFGDLQAIIQKTGGLIDLIRAALAPLVRQGKLTMALVYGSVAAGRQRTGSDVDLLVIGAVSMTELVPLLRTIELRVGREVNPSVYPAKEFKEKLRQGGSFLRRIVKEDKLFVVGDQDELDGLAGQSLDSVPSGKRRGNR